MNPKEWRKQTINDLCQFSNGYGFRPSDWSSAGLPIIRIQNLNGSKKFNFFSGIPKEKWLVEPGTLLFAWAGVKGVSFGPKIWDGLTGVLNQHIYKIHPNKGVEPYWLYALLEVITSRIERKAHGFKTNLLHVRKSDITEQVVFVPPIEEQRKIAEILGTWDEAITLTERLIAAKQQRKKALMQQLLTGKVRFGGVANKAWQDVRLKEIATINANTLSGKSDPEHAYYYIDLASVNRGKIDFPTYKERFANLPSRARRILSKSDVIMSTVRPNLLGFAVCDFPTADVLCSTGFALITPHNSKNEKFIYQSLYGSYIQRQIDGLVTGSNYPAINSTEVKQMRILWPESDKERDLIGQVLSLCDEEITLLQQKAVALRKQKKGLMQQLLTGKVRVKVPSWMCIKGGDESEVLEGKRQRV
jgi:type I restriction enzyme S subunit